VERTGTIKHLQRRGAGETTEVEWAETMREEEGREGVDWEEQETTVAGKILLLLLPTAMTRQTRL
jgi:hypothetical protein